MTTPVCEYAGKDLPQLIQRAIARCMDPAFPVKLNAPERVALATLLRRVEAKDGSASFWVKRCNLAELFEKVERTVSNWLQALEDAGLIVKEQGRTRWGNFSCITVCLTEAATKLLGLQEASSSIRKKTSAGHKEGFNRDSLYERHLAEPARTLSTAGRSGNRSVPDDCLPLLDLGLSESAVFKLMRICTEHKKRLGSIVTARLEAIRGSRNRFAYLRKLASDNIDYASLHALEVEKAEKVEAVKQTQSIVQTSRREYEDAWIQPRPGLRFFLRRGGVPDEYHLVEGTWRLVGAVIGERLLKLFERIDKERPPRLNEMSTS
ncbi:hypothetical protein [Piscinibacter gummiphilus]|uniref:Uncharacterized protein n=1 Tax=Piscinibacter gummiphilus TaxID=946333 RepID=A0ABZ0D6S0_9BURK|nr:hypothetical protein [Piscinibacter gummiphilus]WOB11216.1 hypothetical protein RXV79_26660 [Piscinibacter gummiphilus]